MTANLHIVEHTGGDAMHCLAFCKMLDTSKEFAWIDAGYCIDAPAWVPVDKGLSTFVSLDRLFTTPQFNYRG